MKRVCGVVLSVAPLTSVDASAASWTVLHDGSGDAPTIQAAVDSCAAGDSVLVGEGTFFESVAIDVPLSLIGLGAAHSSILSAAGAEHCLRAMAAVDPLVIETLMLLNAAPAGYGQEGGFAVRGGGSLLMTDCRITDTGAHGTLGVSWSGETRIHGCEFFGLAATGRSVIGCTGSLLEVDKTEFRDSGGVAILSRADVSRVTESRFERLNGERAVVCPFVGAMTLEHNVFTDIDGSAIGEFAPPVTRGCCSDALPGPGLPSVSVDGNTFVRVLEGALVPFFGLQELSFSKNLVTGGAHGVVLLGADDTAVFSCNDIWNNIHDWEGGPDLTGQNGNISLPPLFCAPGTGDYTLAANSPCLPENSPCGELIGAFGQGCGVVSTSPTSWGRLKALYRE